MSKYRRLTDRDRRLGPIEIGARHAEWRPLSIVLSSGDDEHPGCALTLRAFGWSVRVRLPNVIEPHRTKITAQSWDAATIARMGRNWYFEVHPREFGFHLNDGFLQVFLGAQTDDSLTTRSWSKFLPWTQWRHIRRSLFDEQGRHFVTEWDRARGFPLRDSWAAQVAAHEACPAVRFLIEDGDGTRVVVTTRIEEREWRFGTGAFRWLSVFRRPMIKRALDIDFAAEVGPDKGSWKGGLRGTSIEMLPGELHDAAFARYCAREHSSKNGRYSIKLLGRCSPEGEMDVAEAA